MRRNSASQKEIVKGKENKREWKEEQSLGEQWQTRGKKRQREAEQLRHLCLIEIQQQPHLHGGHMEGLVPKLQLSPAQPRPLQSPMWSNVQEWMVLTWESINEKGRDKE